MAWESEFFLFAIMCSKGCFSKLLNMVLFLVCISEDPVLAHLHPLMCTFNLDILIGMFFHIIAVLNFTKMFILRRNALKMMAFSVLVLLFLDHQLLVEKIANAGMLFSCCSSNCKCENRCANKSFQLRPLKKTKLIKTEKCGFGLVADDGIHQGEFIIEYVGEVIDDKTCEERLWKMKRQRYTNFYLCEVSSNMVIDATNKGNKSRFINHSCQPNTEMQKWTVDGETRVGIFALLDIKKGEELTYDYKFVQFGADQDCHCGSSNCRKMVGTSKSVNSIVLHNGNSGSSQDQHIVKKRKTTSDNCIGEIIRLWDRRGKMYVPAVIYDFDEYTAMHPLLFDEEATQKIDLGEEDWNFLPRPEDPDED